MGSNSGMAPAHLLSNPEDSTQGMQVSHKHLAVSLYRKRRNATVHREEVRVEAWGYRLEKRHPVLQRSTKRDAPRDTDVWIGDDLDDLSFPQTKQDALLVDNDGKIQRAPPPDHCQLGVRGNGLAQSLEPPLLWKDRSNIRCTTYCHSSRPVSPGRRRALCGPRLRILVPRQPARSERV